MNPVANGLMCTSNAGIPIYWGTATLVNGIVTVSGVPLSLDGNTVIMVTRVAQNGSTALGILQANSTGRVLGVGGSFNVEAVRTSGGAIETGDQSTFAYLMIG